MLKTKIYRGFSLILCFFISLSFSLTSVHAIDEEEIKIGWYEDSYHTTGKNGERSGYGYEYEQALSSYTGWNYQYVKDDWSGLLEKLEKGDIDLMAAVSYSDERAKSMLFSKLPMGQEKYYLYVNLVGTDITASNIGSLDHKKVALLQNSVQTTQFYNWEEENKIQMEPVFVDSIQEAKQKASKHEIDAVVSTETPLWVDYGMSALFSTGSSDIYYAINKKRSDIKEKLDQAMSSMEYDKPFYSDDLYKKYLSAASSPVLSSEELAWLDQHGHIRIGYLKNDIGFSVYHEKNAKLEGVISDYIASAASCLKNKKLKFEVVGYNSQKEQLDALKKGKIDMIFHFSQNPYIAQKNNLILSNTVLTIPLTVVTTKQSFNEEKENTVAIEKGNLFLKWSLNYNYPNWKIKEYSSFKEVENAVLNKKADCFIVNSNQMSDYSDDNQYRCISLLKAADTTFATNRENTILISILNKTLKTLSTSMLSGAFAMYSNQEKKVTLLDFIKDNALAFILVLVIILFLVLTLLRKSRNSERKAKQAIQHSLELNNELENSKEQLEHALIQAKEASQSKTVFLNNMSHDIRTPMNAIIGFTNIAKKQEVNPVVENCLNKISDSSNLLLTLINDVLDISKIESGHTMIHLETTDITKVTDAVIDITEGLLTNRNLDFKVEITPPSHPYVRADSIRIREILVNILSNAVKFTHDGGMIRFISTSRFDKAKRLIMHYEVSDTGIGMSKEFQKHIFDEFAQENIDARTQYEGTGLGMCIAKKYIDAMHGTITLESEKNKGTTFIIELPLEVVEGDLPKQKAPTIHKDLSKLHLLMAEDNDLNAEIAMIQLEELNIKVTRVINGKEAIDAFVNNPEGTFDLILMDIMMPIMDGYEATHRIRQLENRLDGKTIPIIAMTANAFAEDIQASLEAGMNDHLSKPIEINDVINTIERNLNE